jgi:hypothetical protein
MKSPSPAHRLIQLRRKTEKIANQKVVWDLSNKENNSALNNEDPCKSKHSSKKSSIEKHEKKSNAKKSFNGTQNVLKCTLKNIAKGSATTMCK